MEPKLGHVWLAGAGPGDPGLITVAAAEALAAADVVVYDALVAPALLRRARPGARLIFAGKRAGKQEMAQPEIEALLVREALAGNRVVRLKGGDPFVFGRGGEEAQACVRAGVPFTVIPGISSAMAAPAYAGIPVTHRGVAASFTVMTARDASGPVALPGGAWAGRTLVILMGAASLGETLASLVAAGVPAGTPAAAIRWGTRSDQQVVRATVTTLAEAVTTAGLTAPLVTVVGDVVGLSAELAWFRPGPLAGKQVVVTRARAQASVLAERLAALGADVTEAPVLEVRQIADCGLVVDERVSSRWDWIVFSSANGVGAFFDALGDAGRDARALGTTQVAAIGAATAAALKAQGVIADFQPSRATSACLAEEIEHVRGARILLPVSRLTDASLAVALRRRGGLTEQVAVYTTEPLPLEAGAVAGIAEADAIVFASASSARFLGAALGSNLPGSATRLVSIGPRSSAAVRECFGRLDIEAREPSIESLVEAVREVLQ